jgi:hypothetical protein
LAGRSPDIDKDEDETNSDAGDDVDEERKNLHNPQLLEHLPFSKSIFDLIAQRFYVHGSIVRIINRGYHFFSRTLMTIDTMEEPAIGTFITG